MQVSPTRLSGQLRSERSFDIRLSLLVCVQIMLLREHRIDGRFLVARRGAIAGIRMRSYAEFQDGIDHNKTMKNACFG
jgi:hypothetical protein